VKRKFYQNNPRNFVAGTQGIITPHVTVLPRLAFNAEKFVPHAFQTKRYVLNPSFNDPVVELTLDPYHDIYHITGYAGYNEVGWLGTVTRKGDILRIEEIFLFRQEVGSSTTELNSEHIAEVATKLIEEGAMDKVNALKFWGHVHPSNCTRPSVQDDETMDILENGNPWFLRGIFGRNGRAEFTLYDYAGKVKFDDIPWRLVYPESEERKASIREQVEDLLTPITYSDCSNDSDIEGDLPEEGANWEQEPEILESVLDRIIKPFSFIGKKHTN
jgi:hypothetical protein